MKHSVSLACPVIGNKKQCVTTLSFFVFVLMISLHNAKTEEKKKYKNEWTAFGGLCWTAWHATLSTISVINNFCAELQTL